MNNPSVTVLVDQEVTDQAEVRVNAPSDDGRQICALVVGGIELRNYSLRLSPHDLAEALRKWADQIDAAVDAPVAATQVGVG